MPELNFEQMRNTARDVFEKGTLKTKQGNAVPACLVLQVVKVVAELIYRNDYFALQELQVKMIGLDVSDETIEAIGANTAHDILKDGHIMTAAASEIIRDIVRKPLLTEGTRLILDVSHYQEQFKERANQVGGTIRFNPSSGTFQSLGLG